MESQGGVFTGWLCSSIGRLHSPRPELVAAMPRTWANGAASAHRRAILWCD